MANTHKTPSVRKHMLTADGLIELQRKITELRASQENLVHVIHALQHEQASEPTDVSSSLARLSYVTDEIDRLRAIIATATVIADSDPTDSVKLGSRVKLQKGERELQVTLVSSVEADPANGRISDECPLGKALWGRQLNDDIQYTNARGQQLYYKLVAINT